MEDENKERSKKNISINKFDDIEGKFLLVKVGSKEEPANDSQIEAVRDKLEKFLLDNNVSCLVFVTHHAVDIKIIEKAESIRGAT